MRPRVQEEKSAQKKSTTLSGMDYKEQLLKKIQYRFNNTKLLDLALHQKEQTEKYILSAYSEEAKERFLHQFKNAPYDFPSDPLLVNHWHQENLIYLGCAVLNFLLAHQLFSIYPHENSKFLQNESSIILTAENLYKVAKRLGVIRAIDFTSKQLKANCEKSVPIAVNHFHALIGAMWVDSQFDFPLLLKKMANWFNLAKKYPPFDSFLDKKNKLSDKKVEQLTQPIIQSLNLKKEPKLLKLLTQASSKKPNRFFQRQAFLGQQLLSVYLATHNYQHQERLNHKQTANPYPLKKDQHKFQAILAAVWLSVDRNFRQMMKITNVVYESELTTHYNQIPYPAAQEGVGAEGKEEEKMMAVEPPPPPPPLYEEDHFNGPVYKFRKQILNLDPDDLTASIEPAPIQPSYSAATIYYNRFIPHIFQEIRLVLLEALKGSKTKQTLSPQRILSINPAKNRENPGKIVFNMPLKLPKNLPANNLLTILFINGRPAYITQISPDDPKVDNDVYRLKYVDPLGLFSSTESIPSLSFVQVGALTGYERMYSVCKEKPWYNSPLLFQQIISGQLPPWPLPPSASDKTDNPLLSNLNTNQRKTVESFSIAKAGLYLLQGPPGTGKTTTLVRLIAKLYQQNPNERMLICAPSNKAVQVIAERVLKLSKALDKTIPILIVSAKKTTEKSLELYTLNRLKVLIKSGLAQLTNILPDKIEELSSKKGFSLPYHLESNYQPFLAAIDALKSVFSSGEYHPGNVCINYLLKIVNTYKTKLLSVFEENPANFKEKIAIENEILIAFIKGFNEVTGGFNFSKENLLNQAKIVFATQVITGRDSFNNQRFDTIIIDEAAQAVEAETLIPLRLAKHHTRVLLAGDTKQLPAVITADDNSTFRWSMMWRLREECHQPCLMLTEQYRMAPAIRRWPSHEHYASLLKDAAIISTRVPPPGLHPSIRLINSDGVEVQENHSYFNKREVYLLALVVKKLTTTYPDLSIGVITFYAAQVDHLEKAIRPKKSNISISTVDGFQGDEKDIILISFVRSNLKGIQGFTKDFRRLNVAVTRARHQLILFANIETFKKFPSTVTRFFNYCLAHNYKQQLEAASPPASQRHRYSGGGGGGGGGAPALPRR